VLGLLSHPVSERTETRCLGTLWHDLFGRQTPADSCPFASWKSTSQKRLKRLGKKVVRTAVNSTLVAVTFLALAGCIEQPIEVPANVIQVVDGDTIRIGTDTYRLTGFDTPETYRAACASEKALGDLATNRLRQLIKSHGSISLDVEASRDRYGRLLASARVGDVDVGRVLVSEGLARPYRGGKRNSWCD